MTDTTIQASLTEGLDGPAPVLVLCEHASRDLPEEFGDLGLNEATLKSHIAWDPGALDLSRHLAGAFNAPLVAGAVSRLLYDCNRPPEAPDAVPTRSEIFDIPANWALNPAQRADRVARIYHPFCAAVDAATEQARPQALITVHSFTPVYFGQPRAVEIGLLHDTDSRLAEAMMAPLAGSGLNVQLNQPYGPADGVTHSLQRIALPRNLLNVMIEVRNDLLATPDEIARIGVLLTKALSAALAQTGALAERAF